jgi:hypothetical protein
MVDPTRLHTYPPVYKTHNKNRRETVEEVIENASISNALVKAQRSLFQERSPACRKIITYSVLACNYFETHNLLSAFPLFPRIKRTDK